MCGPDQLVGSGRLAQRRLEHCSGDYGRAGPAQVSSFPAASPIRGFTLIELLVVIAIVGILASLLLPSLTGVKMKGVGIYCLNNHRQLALAWRMYTDDNSGRLLYASPANGSGSDPVSDPYTWVTGYMNFDQDNPSNWDVSRDIHRSPLWSYGGQSDAIWRCPADRSMIRPSVGPMAGRSVPRVRSMSMNLWVGGFGGMDLGLSGGGWRVFLRESEFTDPGPARTFLLLDMREDSIDIGNFATDMRGWPSDPGMTAFYDFPAYYHGRAGGLSFVDGHSETRRWKDARSTIPIVKGGLVPDVVPSPNNPDILWLQERATRPK